MMSTVTSLSNMSLDMFTRVLLLILLSVLLQSFAVKSAENGERYQRAITRILNNMYLYQATSIQTKSKTLPSVDLLYQYEHLRIMTRAVLYTSCVVVG